MQHVSKKANKLSPEERRGKSQELLRQLFIEHRHQMACWSRITDQTPLIQLGYVGQHLVSLVTGYLGTKSGARGADLILDDKSTAEIKTCCRIDQLTKCSNCGKNVSLAEDVCSCGALVDQFKDDSKWLFTIRDEAAFDRIFAPAHHFFVLFEYADLNNRRECDIEATIYKVETTNIAFVLAILDYFFCIKKNAPFNLWPHMTKFQLMQPKVIFKAFIPQKQIDDPIRIERFIGIDNCEIERYSADKLFANQRTVSRESAINILNGSGHCGFSKIPKSRTKTELASLLQDAIDEDEERNAVICNHLAIAAYWDKVKTYRDRMPSATQDDLAFYGY